MLVWLTNYSLYGVDFGGVLFVVLVVLIVVLDINSVVCCDFFGVILTLICLVNVCVLLC